MRQNDNSVFFVLVLGLIITLLYGCATSPSTPPFIFSPPHSTFVFDKTIDIKITSNPSGADTFIEDPLSKSKKYIGKTPCVYKTNFAVWQNAIWFKDPFFTGSQTRNEHWYDEPVKEKGVVLLYVNSDINGRKEGFYNSDVHYENEKLCDHHMVYSLQCTFEFSKDGYQNKKHVYHLDEDGFDVKIADSVPSKIEVQAEANLCAHPKVFAQEFARKIESGDYYVAEEMRIKRIQDLKSGECGGILRDSELTQLERIVGLLDSQLMMFRNLLIESLREGNIETALKLAQTVSEMERKYLPEKKKDAPVIVERYKQEAPESTGYQENSETKQVVVQQKPYWGATDIVEALSAIRGDKISPEAYRKAWGGAKLMDIMGFGSFLNK